MQEAKKHHHVPVFYLRRWCSDDQKIHVIRNINGKIARASHSPSHVGFEYHLYSYTENFDAKDRAEIETKFFKPLDNEGARIVAKIIDGGKMDKRDIILWAQFLTSMKIRTPENVEKIKLEGQNALAHEMEVAQSEYTMLKRENDPATAIDWLELNRPGFAENMGIGLLPKIASNPKAMQDVLSFTWHIVNFENSSKPLLTSDRPCIYTEGLDKPDCVIALPLSPRLAFFAFRPKSNAQSALMRTPTSRLAAGLNESVVSQAVTRAYSEQASDAPDNFFLRRLSPST